MILHQVKGSFNTQLFYLDVFSEDKLQSILNFYKTHKLKQKSCLVSTVKLAEQAQSLLDFDCILNPEEMLRQNISDSDVLILLPSEATQSVVKKLIEGAYPNTLYVNLDHLSHNYNLLKHRHMGDDVGLIPVLKANAYGTGLEPMGKYLETLSVPYFAVVHIGEGIALRKSEVKTRIMVTQPQLDFLDRLIEYNLEPVFCSLKNIQSFLTLLEERSLKDYPIHIKVETGMNRTGFSESEITSLIDLLNEHKDKLQVKTMFSHLSSSAVVVDKIFIYAQIKLFEDIKQLIEKHLNYSIKYHILNSSGVLNYSDYNTYHYCRSGMGLHGFTDYSRFDDEVKLYPIIILKTKIVQIREIKPGDAVSYGRTFIAEHRTRVATLPIGYADFLGRMWGNEKGSVFINGQKARILGTICMDLMMVDVSVVDCQEGDEVEIFGSNISLKEVAKVCQTIPYEIMTSLNPLRINRIYTVTLN